MKQSQLEPPGGFAASQTLAVRLKKSTAPMAKTG
jgi:hypothetical protein